MVKVILNKSEIEEAITLADVTFARWKNRAGHYPNRYNSHLKGKLGELAIEKFLRMRNHPFVSYFRQQKSQGLCDIEIENANKSRLEIKIWSLEHWADQGRCVRPNQMGKIQLLADALVWCVVDLPPIKSAADLDKKNELPIEIRGWSTVGEVAGTEIRKTGRMELDNHQVEESDMHDFETLLLS